MKQVLIAAFITLFLLVGGVALTFAFQAPEDNPRVFSLEDARQEELAYRAETVRSAEELISGGITLLMANAPREEQAAVRPALATVRANLSKLGEIDLGMDPASLPEGATFSVREENNRLVDDSVNSLLRSINAPSMQAAIYRLADHIDLRLRVRWEPDMEKVDVGWEVYQQNCSTCHGAYGDGDQITPEGLSVFPPGLHRQVPQVALGGVQVQHFGPAGYAGAGRGFAKDHPGRSARYAHARFLRLQR